MGHTAVILQISTLAAALLLPARAAAQADVEYRLDIGAAATATGYTGDFNASPLTGMQPGGSVIARLTPNTHTAYRAGLNITKIKGDYKPDGNQYPVYPEGSDGYAFSNTLVDLSLLYEYNFWHYGTGHEYRGAKRLAPFIALGLGMTFVSSADGTYDYGSGDSHSTSKSVITANIPVGLGMKYRLGDRTNLSLDWMFHFTLSDNLDGVADPYRIKSSGFLKNTDCYATFTLAITYSLSPRCSTCHKL